MGDDETTSPAVLNVRLQAIEELVRAFGPTVTAVAAHTVKLDDAVDDIRELRDTGRAFRVEVRAALERGRAECNTGLDEVRRELLDEVRGLRSDIAADRAESRNRTILALGPIALAAVGVFAKVVLGIDLPHP